MTIRPPDTTFDQIIPAVGLTSRMIHRQMICHTPKSGRVQVIPWVRSSAEPNAIASTATVNPTIRLLTVSRVDALKPTIHGDTATYIAVSNVNPKVIWP